MFPVFAGRMVKCDCETGEREEVENEEDTVSLQGGQFLAPSLEIEQ